MPASFDDLGVHFLYPENWTVIDQLDGNQDAANGVTLETPEGAFFSLNRYSGVESPQKIVDRAVMALRELYDSLELEDYGALAHNPNLVQLADESTEAGADVSFYVLDLLITARVLAISHEDDIILIQTQAESRDFDRLEPVFAAVLKTLRDSLVG